MIFKLAWRNIWRNKRRTLITITSVAFAVFFATFMQSIQQGAWGHMLDNVVNFYYGYVQVQHKGYWEEQSLDKALEWNTELHDQLLDIEGVEGVVPRLESFALATGESLTTGVLLVGTDAENEAHLTQLSSRVVAGRYWSDNDKGLLLADGAAERLELGVGDTVVLLSQGYRGVNSVGKYHIDGLLHFGSPELNNRMAYLRRPEAEQFFGTSKMATSVALNVLNKEDVPAIVDAIEASIDTSVYQVMGWESMIPELVEAKELDAAGNNLVLFILYFIITFGIFGTILMMTRERNYEFGVLVGIGMHRWQLGFTVWIEIVLLGLLGAALGMLISFPLVYYFSVNPIDLTVMGEEAVEAYEKFGMEPILPTLVSPPIFWIQALLVALITTLLALYPWYKIVKLKPMQAMREG